jgi:hypothetical protein
MCECDLHPFDSPHHPAPPQHHTRTIIQPKNEMPWLGSRATNAAKDTVFWGDEMGVNMPPMLHENAKDSKRHRANGLSRGKSRIMGNKTAKTKTGAATLFMNMLNTKPRVIMAKINKYGRSASLRWMYAAPRIWNWNLENAAAMEKPGSVREDTHTQTHMPTWSSAHVEVDYHVRQKPNQNFDA